MLQNHLSVPRLALTVPTTMPFVAAALDSAYLAVCRFLVRFSLTVCSFSPCIVICLIFHFLLVTDELRDTPAPGDYDPVRPRASSPAWSLGARLRQADGDRYSSVVSAFPA